MNYSNIPIVSPFGYIPPEAFWWFIGTLVVFIVIIHIHAINRD